MCPMTQENIEKHGLTSKQVKEFCNKGCSVMCEQLFKKQFGKEGLS